MDDAQRIKNAIEDNIEKQKEVVNDVEATAYSLLGAAANNYETAQKLLARAKFAKRCIKILEDRTQESFYEYLDILCEHKLEVEPVNVKYEHIPQILAYIEGRYGMDKALQVNRLLRGKDAC